MGTEILQPQDCLIQRLRAVPTISPRRNQQTNNPKSCRKQARRSSDPHPKKPYPEDPTPKPGKGLVAGQVTILKRGESLDSKKSESKRTDLRKSSSLDEADLAACGTGRLGPDPTLVPKQIRLKEAAALQLRSDVYAGSAFSQSPSPRSLPLPSFSTRRAAAVAVDDSATKDLRRMLRLE